MIEVPSKEDYDRLSATIAEMMQEIQTKHNGLLELAKSTSHSLGKMQEELDQMPSGYRNSQDIKNLKGRIERLEARDSTRTSTMDEDTHRVFDRVLKMEDCCKNTVASGKALEEKVDYMMNNGLGKTDIKSIVRDILKSL